MEALFGIKGANFVLLATDTRAVRSIVVMKSQEEKFRQLNPTAVLAYCGEPGDTVNFAEFIQRNVQLYGVKNELDLAVGSAAHWTRKALADSLRSRSPYQVNVLIGGVEKDNELSTSNSLVPKLYWIDYMAAIAEVPYAVHGYAAHFCLSLLDRHWREGMNEEQVLHLLKLCLNELKTRFIVNMPDLAVRIVRESGVETVQL